MLKVVLKEFIPLELLQTNWCYAIPAQNHTFSMNVHLRTSPDYLHSETQGRRMKYIGHTKMEQICYCFLFIPSCYQQNLVSK